MYTVIYYSLGTGEFSLAVRRLENEVNILVKEGFTPCGGIVIMDNGIRGERYISQSMYKPASPAVADK